MASFSERTYLLPYLHLLPFAYLQGRNLRAKLPDVPVASGAMNSYEKGFSQDLTVWYLGDSLMEGVGAIQQATGLPAWLSKRISMQMEQNVKWSIFAKSGYRAREIHQHILPNLPDQHPNYVFVSVGANDVMKLNPIGRFETEIEAFFEKLRATLPNTKIAILPIAPMERFPTFPSTVKKIFGSLSRKYNQRMAAAAAPHALQVIRPFIPSHLMPKHFSPDGVHPGPLGYQYVADWVMKNLRS